MASIIDALADELGQKAAAVLAARVNAGQPATQADFDGLKHSLQSLVAARLVEWRGRAEAVRAETARLAAANAAELSEGARALLVQLRGGVR